MDFKAKLRNEKFVITGEIAPPKGTNIKSVVDKAVSIKKFVDAINVTDLQSANMRLGSLAMSEFLLQKGIEPIYQITCRDRNRLALQSDILSAAAFGIKNILVLTGDDPSCGDHPNAKKVFDLNSISLLEAIHGLQKGKDMAGNMLNGTPQFCIGAAVNPFVKSDIKKLEKKIKVGVDFIQTQPIFDIKLFENFMKKTNSIGKGGKKNIPILAGIILIKSEKMALHMNKNIPGIHIPPYLIKRISLAEDKKKEAVCIAIEIMNSIKNLCQGFHIMSLGWEDLIPQILVETKIR